MRISYVKGFSPPFKVLAYRLVLKIDCYVGLTLID